MAQLKSTNITGNLAVTGNILASKIIKLGGTNDDILMGDGSITSKQALIDSLEAAMEGDTNTWRTIQVNGTDILGSAITTGKLNLKAGSNVSVTNSSGTVTFAATDTGATSVEVTGNGQAIVNASYDATNRKITFTKGGFFISEVSSTDNAIARFDGPEGSLQDSGIFINDNNQLDVSAGSIKLNKIYAPSSSGGTTYTTGTNKYVLKSNGTTVYWATDSNTNTISSAFCQTAADVAAKEAACTGYVKSASSQLHIIMMYDNTAAGQLTLNVNGQGAKPIYINGTVSSTTNYTLPAGSYIIYFDTNNYYFRTDGSLTANIIGSAEKLQGKKPEITLTANSDDKIPTSKAVADYINGLGYGADLPLAASGTRGGIQIGYSETENNRALKLNAEKAYVELPTRLYGGRTDSTAPDSALKSGFYYTSNLPASLGFTSNQGTMFVSSYSDDWVAQMVIGCYTNKLAYRKKGTSWTDWKTVATEDWVEGKGYLTSHQSLSGYVTGSGLTADYLVLGNGSSSIKKGDYQITTNIVSNNTNAYIPTAKSVSDYVVNSLNGIRYQIPQAFNFGTGTLSISDSTIQNKIIAASILVSRIEEGSNYTYGTFYKTCETESYIYYSDTTTIYWAQNEDHAYVKNLRYNMLTNTFTWTPDA